jgi:hypothetical protein
VPRLLYYSETRRHLHRERRRHRRLDHRKTEPSEGVLPGQSQDPREHGLGPETRRTPTHCVQYNRRHSLQIVIINSSVLLGFCYVFIYNYGNGLMFRFRPAYPFFY